MKVRMPCSRCSAKCKNGAYFSTGTITVGWYTTTSVTHGHCNAVNFSAAVQSISALYPVPNYNTW